MIIRTESDKDKAQRHIKALNIDKPWSVEIKLYKKNRTLYPVKKGAIGEIKAGRSWGHIQI